MARAACGLGTSSRCSRACSSVTTAVPLSPGPVPDSASCLRQSWRPPEAGHHQLGPGAPGLPANLFGWHEGGLMLGFPFPPMCFNIESKYHHFVVWQVSSMVIQLLDRKYLAGSVGEYHKSFIEGGEFVLRDWLTCGGHQTPRYWTWTAGLAAVAAVSCVGG